MKSINDLLLTFDHSSSGVIYENMGTGLLVIVDFSEPGFGSKSGQLVAGESWHLDS